MKFFLELLGVLGYTAGKIRTFNNSAEVAQLVEQGTENPCVASSILALGTIYFVAVLLKK